MKRRLFISTLLVLLLSVSACSKPEPAVNPAPNEGGAKAESPFDPTKYAVSNRTLNDTDAARLEAALLGKPDDVKARVDLLWYYRGQFGDDDARAQANKHLLWLITNQPRAAVLGTPAAAVTPFPSREAYDTFEAKWLKQAEQFPQDPRVLGHAGMFMSRVNPLQAAKLLEKAIELDAKNPLWNEYLAEVYHEQAAASADGGKVRWATRALALYDVAMAQTHSDLRRRYLLVRMATTALMAGDEKAAATHASALLKAASAEEPGPDRSESMHNAHVVLGRLKLLADDARAAAEHLAEAGVALADQHVLLSQLDLSLAASLLSRGDKSTVIGYLQAVAKATDATLVQRWIKAIETGEQPDFGPYLPS